MKAYALGRVSGDRIVGGGKIDGPQRVRCVSTAMTGCGVQHIPSDVEAVREPGANGKKFDCRSKVGAGGEDLFMEIAISRQDINSPKAETTAAGRATHASRSGR